MTGMIEPVPRAEAERLFPKLKGQPLWGEKESYDSKECAGLHYIVYGPIEVRAVAQATKMFKSVKVVNHAE